MLESVLVPPDDWGFAGPNSTILFGANFDVIEAFTITWAANAVGIGLDEFFIDQPAPEIPVPAGLPLLAGGLGMLAFVRRRNKG